MRECVCMVMGRGEWEMSLKLIISFWYLGETKILGYDAVELRGKMELLKTIGSSDVLAHAALLGEEETIKEYLDEYPNDVS